MCRLDREEAGFRYSSTTEDLTPSRMLKVAWEKPAGIARIIAKDNKKNYNKETYSTEKDPLTKEEPHYIPLPSNSATNPSQLTNLLRTVVIHVIVAQLHAALNVRLGEWCEGRRGDADGTSPPMSHATKPTV
ncbi:hypothetical protein E2C01_009642 [Portunus trituberculatus]|uniref:Uncharacterized protein n=1 Tax=Portunus trituberculatus TaxID=210409 RepID=A0A5B7D6B4_PORTR|nr:hypothetical protein [Portunus trituberculatus]